MTSSNPRGPAGVTTDHGPEGSSEPVDRASVKEGFGFAAASFGVNALVGLMSSVLTARLYGINSIGEYALVIAPWLTLVQFSSLGEQIAFVRRIALFPRHDPRIPGQFLALLVFSVGLTAAVAVVIGGLSVAALRGPIDQPDLVLPAMVVLVGYIVFENTSWNLDALFSAFRAGRELFWSRLTQMVGFLVLAAALRPLFPSVWGLAFATVGSFVAALVVRLVLIHRFTRVLAGPRAVRDGMRTMPEILLFSLRLVPSRFVSGLIGQAGPWVIGAFGTVAGLGAYSRAANIAVRLNDAGYRISEILFPALVERHAQGDHEGFDRALGTAMRVTAGALLLIAAAGGGAAEGVMDVFGEGFRRGALPLALLLMSGALSVSASVQGNVLVAIGRPGMVTWISLVRAVFALGAMVPAAQRWGASGVAGSMLLGTSTLFLTQTIVVRRLLGRWGLGSRAARTVAGLLVAYAGAFALARVVDQALDGLLGTAVAGMCGAAAYALLALASGALHPDDRERLAGMAERVRTRSRSRRG